MCERGYGFGTCPRRYRYLCVEGIWDMELGNQIHAPPRHTVRAWTGFIYVDELTVRHRKLCVVLGHGIQKGVELFLSTWTGKTTMVASLGHGVRNRVDQLSYVAVIPVRHKNDYSIGGRS